MKRCFLCKSKDSVLDFDTAVFKNCSSKLLWRKHKKFKYGEVNLTKESLDVVGYHSSCYKRVTSLANKYTEDFSNFIANLEVPSLTSTSRHCTEQVLHSLELSAIPDPEVPCASITVDLKSSDAYATIFPSKSSTCNKQATCLFCNCKQKRSGNTLLNLIFPLCEDSIQKIRARARSLDDSEILSKLDNQTVAHHKVCYATYQKKEKRSTEESVDSTWHQLRRLHKLAYESLSNFITREIIENYKVMYFSQLFLRYQALLLEFGEYMIEYEDITDYRPDILERKIIKYFGDHITIEASAGPRCKKIVYKTDIDVSVLANKTKLLETQDENRFQNVAYDLRNSVKNIDNKPLPSGLPAEDVIRGECVIPKILLKFMRDVISGPDISNNDSVETTVQIASICRDIIHAITKGRTKPAKHPTLGMAAKS